MSLHCQINHFFTLISFDIENAFAGLTFSFHVLSYMHVYDIE
jgi:hypothetical protein